MRTIALESIITLMLLIAPMDVSGQVRNGVSGPPYVADEARIAAPAKTHFVSLLVQTLSGPNIEALLRLVAQLPTLNGSGVTNFDDAAASCGFQSALRGLRQYAFFAAPGNDGGAVLDQCSNFGVSAFSPPNFLAYNSGITYSNGGVSKLPQIIAVGANRSSVTMQISAGNKAGVPIAVVALGPGGVKGVASVVSSK